MYRKGGDSVENIKIAKVAVSAANLTIDKPYDYKITEKFAFSAVPGMRVTVPFGRGNRKSEGIILAVSEGDDRPGLKSIEQVLDDEAMLLPWQIKLAVWMRERFFCTVYDAVRAMLPAGMWFKDDGSRKVKDKTVAVASLNVSGEEALIVAEQKKLRAPQQAEILKILSAAGHVAVKEICYFTGASSTTVKALEKQGFISIEHVEVYRRPEYGRGAPAPELVLNAEQEKAFKGLKELADNRKAAAALLYGVTGSGKTAIYINLIKEVIKTGRSAIVLVPEIGLTPQFVEIFSSHFGEDIALLHSSLSMGERYDEWKRIRSGEVKVVIGTRSAVFAPLSNLGVIIMDEEQEYTYKSENTPRYNTRDISKFLCVQANALFLMGSATPDIETMYMAQQGKYSLFTLDTRYNEKQLPQVLIADMKKELKNGVGGSISSLLYEELKKNIENGEQSILFINRRGASNLVVCGECGYTYTCPNCSVSMTYHSANHRFMCHYCGYSSTREEECLECGGKLKFIGSGTQKVEEEIRELFPDIEVIRMDTDTVSPAKSHEKLLAQFRDKNVPVLIGTQMVTKGLDFSNVTLVGVISADQMLYVNNYRAHERTFDLITQVVGRSGRGEKTGRAVIQTFTPNNEVLHLAAKQDYMSFYERELAMRKILGCPPIADLFSVTVTGLDESAVLRGCVKIRESFKNYFSDIDDTRVLGPAPASVTKVNNRYRYRVILSCENTKRVRETIMHVMREFANDKQNRKLSVFADINPLD